MESKRPESSLTRNGVLFLESWNHVKPEIAVGEIELREIELAEIFKLLYQAGLGRSA